MEVIRGKHAYVEFYKEGQFRKFGCAKEFVYEGEMDIKSVRTIGDGPYKRFRGTTIGYTISLSGLVVYDEPTMVTFFDLREYWKQMVDISYQIIFEKEDTTLIDMLRGDALVIKPSISGGIDFARTSFVLQGNGEPLFGLPPTCDKVITSYTLTRQGLTFVYNVKIISLNSGSVSRYDWKLDSGDLHSSLDTGWPINIVTYSGFIYGTHLLEIWPVCDNGVQGTKLAINFTVPFG